MERYHSIAGDPPRRDMQSQLAASAQLEQQIAKFLARGGKAHEVGAQMRATPEPFVINPRTTPVYNQFDANKRMAKALVNCFGSMVGGAK